jgi:hypothetical protein
MENYSEKTLDLKIQAFIARKTEQYPELMKSKNVQHVSLHEHFSSMPVITSMRALKPQLLG